MLTKENDIANITETQTEELNNILQKWFNIKGDYCETLLQGIAHYKCDSGIMSDAYSSKDVDYIKEHMIHLLDEDGIETDEFYEEIHNYEDELEFINCSYELYKFSEKHNFVDEDVYSLATELEEGVRVA